MKSTTRTRRLLALAALAALTAFVGGAWVGSASATPPATPKEARPHSAAQPDKGPVTTSGRIRMRNLESELLDAELRIAEDSTNARASLQRSNLVYLRARVTGEIDEMARALALTDRVVREHPALPEAWLLRATQAQTLHRFADARADLQRARALGADESKIAVLERELDWNEGVSGPTARDIREEAARRPTVASLSRLARLEHDLGRHDEADALYARALARVEGTDPIPVAMLEVQRGMSLSDAGRLTEAAEAFRNAAARLPAYAAAREHLAETLHRLGEDDEAIALYEELTRTSSDPEFMGALAAIYRAHDRIAEADVLRARATARYDELLTKYPDAMAWHAAEYFAGEGADRARALSLLRRNAELRPNAESLETLARLEREAGDAARADDLTRRAAALRAAAQQG